MKQIEITYLEADSMLRIFNKLYSQDITLSLFIELKKLIASLANAVKEKDELLEDLKMKYAKKTADGKLDLKPIPDNPLKGELQFETEEDRNKLFLANRDIMLQKTIIMAPIKLTGESFITEVKNSTNVQMTGTEFQLMEEFIDNFVENSSNT